MTVEQHLANVDYSFKDYTPTENALLFINFIKMVNDGAEENETPLLHSKILDDVLNEDKLNAIMIHRGAGKTTLFAEYMILFIAAFGFMPGFGEVDFILYVTDSIENGVKNLRRNVEFRYQNSEFLQKLIPNHKIKAVTEDEVEYDLGEVDTAKKTGVRFTDVRLEFANHEGKSLIVKGYGVSTGVRGTKEQGKRPTLAVLDDLLSDDDARSPTVIGNVNDIIYKAVNQALHPKKRKIIYLGTPFNANDPLYVAVESGEWTASVYPICESFPVAKSEFKGSWEDRFPYEFVRQQHNLAVGVGQPQSFYQELMLKIYSDDDKLIDPSTVEIVEYKEVIKSKDVSNFYITTDFATSEKKTADFSGIAVWQHLPNDELVVIDGFLKRARMQENIDRLFEFVERYRPALVGVEITGQQGGFIDWIKAEMQRRGVWFTLAKQQGKKELGIRPTKNKVLRFERVLPLFRRGQIKFTNTLVDSQFGRELFEEMELASSKGFMSKHDDAIDCISQIMDIGIYKPSGKAIPSSEPKKRTKFDRIFGDEPDPTPISAYSVDAEEYGSKSSYGSYVY